MNLNVLLSSNVIMNSNLVQYVFKNVMYQMIKIFLMKTLKDIIVYIKENLAVRKEDLLYIYMNDITIKSIHLIIHLIYGKDFY